MQSLYEQATSLASNAFEYAKETAHMSQAKASEGGADAQKQADQLAQEQTGHTLGGLVDQAKQLAADTIGTAKSSVSHSFVVVSWRPRR